jgi:hypothetical protein
MKTLKTPFLWIATLVVMATSPLAALAQEPGRDATPKVTSYDYEEDQIQGRFQTHGGELVQGERARTTASLITPRANFLPELLKSAEDL